MRPLPPVGRWDLPLVTVGAGPEVRPEGWSGQTTEMRTCPVCREPIDTTGGVAAVPGGVWLHPACKAGWRA